MVPRLQYGVDARMSCGQDPCMIGLDAGRFELQYHTLGVEFDDFTADRRCGAYPGDSGERLGDLTDDPVQIGCETEVDLEGSETPRV